MENDYLKYFEKSLAELQQHLNNSDVNAYKKEKLKIRIELTKELQENLDWQIKNPIQKQALRIQNLVTIRKNEAPLHLIKNQELIIKFCDLISVNIPYIEALENIDTTIIKPILDLCNSYRLKIDFAGPNYIGNLPDTQEIEKAFGSFNKIEPPSKCEMFKESLQKIGHLYKEFKIIAAVAVGV